MKVLAAAAGVLGSLLAAAAARAQAISDPTKVDVCQRVPGQDVAAALGKGLKGVRSTTTEDTSRCVYLLALPGKPDAPVPGVVLWLYKAEDYDELAKYTEAKAEKVQGLGDEAMRFRDPGDGLHKLRVVKRGRFAVEAVAADPESSRKLAELGLARLSK
jgi:hypothetical protein